MPKCLVCFGPVDAGDYHPRCCRALFDTAKPLTVDFGYDDLPNEGLRLLAEKGPVPGVQAKLSLGRDPLNPTRLTIQAFRGRFILKPPSPEYPHLPENEALCMELARRLGIRTAPHGLARMADGTIAYLSRRFDRPAEDERLHQEDFCQLSERSAADKYKGSLEAAAKVLRFSRQPGLDAVRFLELNLFCWLSGNADMHLKNFSLLEDADGGWALSPAYDLVSTALALPSDREESALSVNGKKSRLAKDDWLAFSARLGIGGKVFDRLFDRFAQAFPTVEEAVRASLLPPALKDAFLALWRERAEG